MEVVEPMVEVLQNWAVEAVHCSLLEVEAHGSYRVVGGLGIQRAEVVCW